MIIIVTDTASDITYTEARDMRVRLVLLPVTFDEEYYNQESDESFGEFYRLLVKTKALPKTSQPSPAQYLDIFNEAKKNNDDVLVLTLSSGLSGTYETALNAKVMSEYGNITVIDSTQATLTQRMLVYYAVRLRDMGKTAGEIADALISVRSRITIYGMVDTLTYLKKGGRIPPAVALIGNTLSIKPIIILKDTKLEMLGKVRGVVKGKKFLCDEFEKDEIDTEWPVCFGYTRDREIGEEFMNEAVLKYGLTNTSIYPIGCVIGTHLGPGCLAIAYVKKA